MGLCQLECHHSDWKVEWILWQSLWYQVGLHVLQLSHNTPLCSKPTWRQHAPYRYALDISSEHYKIKPGCAVVPWIGPWGSSVSKQCPQTAMRMLEQKAVCLVNKRVQWQAEFACLKMCGMCLVCENSWEKCWIAALSPAVLHLC